MSMSVDAMSPLSVPAVQVPREALLRRMPELSSSGANASGTTTASANQELPVAVASKLVRLDGSHPATSQNHADRPEPGLLDRAFLAVREQSK